MVSLAHAGELQTLDGRRRRQGDIRLSALWVPVSWNSATDTEQVQIRAQCPDLYFSEPIWGREANRVLIIIERLFVGSAERRDSTALGTKNPHRWCLAHARDPTLKLLTYIGLGSITSLARLFRSRSSTRYCTYS